MAMQWFGESWGAPLNEECEHVPTPVDQVCMRCRMLIREADPGVLLIHHEGRFGGLYRTSRRPWHLNCLFKALGIIHS